MKKHGISIRIALYILFVAILLIPLIEFMGGVQVVGKSLYKSVEMQQLRTDYQLVKEIVDLTTKNVSKINDYNTFKTIMTPYLNDNSRLILHNEKNYVLFDSHDNTPKTKIINPDYLGNSDLKFKYSFFAYNANFINSKNGKFTVMNSNHDEDWYRYEFKINQENNDIYGMYIVNYTDLLNSISSKAHLNSKRLSAFMYASLIVIVYILSRVIKCKMLIPLNQLNSSAKAIANKDFTKEVTYNKNDEMGKFCNAFNDMKQQLLISRQNLVQESEARKLLIGNIAHDLRTPITSIKGYIEGLQDGIVKDKQALERYYKVINDKTNELDFLINDLFTFSQLELGQLKVNQKPVKKLDLLKPYLNKEYEVPIVIAESCLVENELLYIDKKQIDRVFRNIIVNSVKFGANNINICCRVVNDFLQITITDNGIGIESNNIKKVFERFFTYVPNNAEKAGGSGMGLAICKEIVELHNGQIKAKSEKGEGTSIVFTLPLFN
ncbi:HAMP domain-containing histidine kinase [Clostridium sp. 'deep sea']|uniref:HAMP domain-containing sensor histidine kinase n=1 Tax=Clostridium sp. 'deep sea' TaxID=2779445 RepID=UPI0018966731|nr:HAMP domain-containing sensor histidine kinase [Clostridium sp. 'deep sea']QOR36716.1 HAMP domain-containing histidine kinase [Clostridium sp. 'deep sea']